MTGGIAIVGTKGSPGTTTLALALGAVWPRPVLVTECDPSGGDMATRFGLQTQPGMASLVLALRRDLAAPSSKLIQLAPHIQELPGGLGVIVGAPAGDSALALDQELAGVARALLESSSAEETDMVFDCGRFTTAAEGQFALLCEVETVVLLASPEATSLVFAHWMATRISAARADRSGLALAVIGNTPLRPSEMAEALSMELAATIPIDPVGAALLGGKPGRPRALARSALISAATRLARTLVCSESDRTPETAPETTAVEEHRNVS